jgi:ketosteroid isomerase-like protein
MTVRQHQDRDTIEHIFRAWDDALAARDLDASMALYYENATLESPLGLVQRQALRGGPAQRQARRLMRWARRRRSRGGRDTRVGGRGLGLDPMCRRCEDPLRSCGGWMSWP